MKCCLVRSGGKEGLQCVHHTTTTAVSTRMILVKGWFKGWFQWNKPLRNECLFFQLWMLESKLVGANLSQSLCWEFCHSAVAFQLSLATCTCSIFPVPCSLPRDCCHGGKGSASWSVTEDKEEVLWLVAKLWTMKESRVTDLHSDIQLTVQKGNKRNKFGYVC